MDKVADALIRIKNAYMVGKMTTNLKYSKLVVEICKLLEKEGFIKSFEVKVKEREIVLNLKYKEKDPALADIKRISKPGLRVYKGSKSLPYVLNGLGIAIISTPKGIMTEKEARKSNLGGEVLAEVW